MDDTRINELIDIFKELAELAGGYEETKIMPNLEVIDASPADLPANFIIISDDEGFYVPAIKAAGLTVSNGDFVNVLYIKGTEPIAFQHGSSSSGGGGAGAQNLQLYHSGAAVEYATLALANAAAASGDTIVVYPGTYTADDISLTAGCNLIVIDPDNTTFSTATGQYCLRIGAGSYVYGVRATVTTSHAAHVAAIYITGNAATLENCIGIGSNSHATGFSYAFYKQGATGLNLLNCYGDGSGATSNDNYGFRQDNSSGDTAMFDCRWKGDAADIYFDGEAVTVHNPYLYTGIVAGNAVWAGVWDELLLIKNTSGAFRQFGDVGYIDYVASVGGEFKTTTTASDAKFPSACVVVGPGNNNVNIFVRTSGKAKVQYVSTAPAAGDFLLFSTTAGALTLSTTMHPNLVAVAQAAGSNGLVEALLYPRRTFVSASITTAYQTLNNASLDFVATIATLPGGAVLTYNAPSSGNENTIVPQATYNYKLVLHNTTRGTSALITAVNAGTNTVTLTANVPAGWQVGDTITARSQTLTAPVGAGYFYELDTNNSLPTLTTAVVIAIVKGDTGAGGQWLLANSFSATQDYSAAFNPAANVYAENGGVPMKLLNKKFCISGIASGAATANDIIRQIGYFVATP